MDLEGLPPAIWVSGFDLRRRGVVAPVARLPSGSTGPQCAHLPCPHGEDRGGRPWRLGQNNSIQFNCRAYLYVWHEQWGHSHCMYAVYGISPPVTVPWGSGHLQPLWGASPWAIVIFVAVMGVWHKRTGPIMCFANVHGWPL